jgi:hypothetical protein
MSGQIDAKMVADWRINYGLDTRTPAEAMRWWHDNMDGKAPAGAVAALGLCIDEIERLRAENEVLREIERDVSNALPGVYYMDPPDGGSVPLGEQVRRMAVDAARYRWLRGDSCPNHSSRWTQWEVRCWKAPSWTGDLRRADLDDAIDAARGKE